MSKSSKLHELKEVLKNESEDIEKTETEGSETAISHPKEIKKDIRSVKISIDYLEKIRSDYPVTFVYIQSFFNNNLLNESPKSLVIDERVKMNWSFQMELNILSNEDIDNFVSKPIIFMVNQLPGEGDTDILVELEKQAAAIMQCESKLSFDSAISQYELFTGITVESKEEIKQVSMKGGKGKGKKVESVSAVEKKKEDKNKPKKNLKKSETDLTQPSTTSRHADIDLPFGNVLGMCTLDLLPLILGNQTYTATAQLKQLTEYNDDRMLTYKNVPKMIVTVSIDNPIEFQINKPTILNFTIESIFNIPTIMASQAADCKICAWVPMTDSYDRKQLFQNGVLIQEDTNFEMKIWPDIRNIGNNPVFTDYRARSDFKNVKHNFGSSNLDELIKKDNAKIYYNFIKRNVLLEPNRIVLRNYLSKYRQILIEVFIGDTLEDLSVPVHSATVRQRSASKLSVETTDDKKKKQKSGYLHLMALVDISSLVYPGVTSTRVSSQLSTYNEKEVFAACGIRNSYYLPKKTSDIATPKKSVERLKKPAEVMEQKSTKSKGSDKKGTKKEVLDGNLKGLLPAPPPPDSAEEPSAKVYNESGDPTVIIIEVEISETLTKSRPLDDLLENLHQVLPAKPNVPKLSLSFQALEGNYQDIIEKISDELLDIYETYLKENNLCECPERADFLTYLRRSGVYQKYLGALRKSVSVLVHKKFEVSDSFLRRTNKQHQELIGQMYVYLVGKMNQVLNKRVCPPSGCSKESKMKSSEKALFYAKEATEMKNYQLADKYHMERLCLNENDPDVWFDYALFHLELDSKEMSFEYLNEALSRKMEHTNSLLAYGIFLTEKGKLSEAETCFMSVLVHHPRWVEAWGVLLLFHQRNNNVGGVTFTEDMAKLYLNDKRVDYNYFMKSEELAWTSSICPDTVYFKTAVLLLKLRMYRWVEDALSHEIAKHPGIVNYLLAVVCYYKEDYDHALDHLNQAKLVEGWNYAIVTLAGHCLLWKRDYKEAKEQYYYVLESYNRPDDMHLLYVNCANCLSVLGEEQEARKLMLIALKYNATPYAWLVTGTLFYYQNDLMSAEECLISANFCNNRLAEVWAFLALINLKMDRETEAELCYQQSIKNNLEDETLLAELMDELNEFKKRNVSV